MEELGVEELGVVELVVAEEGMAMVFMLVWVAVIVIVDEDATLQNVSFFGRR